MDKKNDNKVHTTEQYMRDSPEESDEEPIILNLSKSSSKRKAIEERMSKEFRPTKKMKEDDDSDYTLVSY